MLDLFYVGTVQQIYKVLLHSELQVFRAKFVDSKSAVSVFVKFDVCIFLVVISVCAILFWGYSPEDVNRSQSAKLCVYILFSYHNDECILNRLTCW